MSWFISLRVAYVEACNAEGACSARTSIAFRPPPPAPSGIVAVADGSTEVDLTWRSVANATRYEVEYKTTASDAWIDPPGSTTATSTSVAGLECGTGHDFRVRAHGDGTNRASHWGPWSATASEDTEACVVNRPGAPANVALTVRDRQLEVAWDTPTSDGGSSVSGHQFRYRVHGTQTWTESAEYTTASTRSQRSPSDELDLAQRVIAGLGNGTEYDVEMRVKNANGYGSWTEQQPVSATPAAATIAIESIVDASLEVGGSTVFSVRAENLSTTVDYTIRLSTSDTGADAGVLKFNSCGTNAADSIDFSIGTNASAVTIRGALAVYACAEGGDDLRATLIGGGGDSPSAVRAISVGPAAIPTPTFTSDPEFAHDGATIEADFDLPRPGFYYQLVVYRSTDGGTLFSDEATRNLRHGEQSATVFSGFKPKKSDKYKLALKACRDSARTDCGPLTESAVFSAATIAMLTIEDLSPQRIQGGQFASFTAVATNLSSDQSYTLKVHTDSGGALKYNGCTTGSDPFRFGVYDNASTLNVRGINVYACRSATDSHNVYATLSVGSIELGRSNELLIDTSPVLPPRFVRAYGTGTDSVKVRWQPVTNALYYTIQFDAYSEDTPSWTLGTERTVSSPRSRTIDHNGVQITFLEKEFDSLSNNQFYSIRMRTVSGELGTLEMPSEKSAAGSAWVYVATSLPANDPPLAHPAAPHEYVYTICASSLVPPASGWTEDDWIFDIHDGVSQWNTRVRWLLENGEKLVSSRVDNAQGDCSAGAHETNNVVKGAYNQTVFRRNCNWEPDDLTQEQMDAKACTSPHADYTVLSIFFWTNFDWDPGNTLGLSCSNVERIAAHEAGHVFGVGPHTEKPSTVMLAIPESCWPTPWDVMLVVRGFQVR